MTDPRDIASIGIIVISLLIAYLDFRYWLQEKIENWRWIKLAYSIIGFYWFILYGYVFIYNIEFSLQDRITVFGVSYSWGELFVRPALLLTLSAMLAGSIIRAKRGHRE